MDPASATEELFGKANFVGEWLISILPKIGAAVVLLIVGYLFAAWMGRFVRRVVAKTGKVDDTLYPIIGSVVRYAILIIVIVAALGQLGVQTASMLAALGAIGLAIGLALQGTLSNIAAGIMLLWLRPFSAGDTIETVSVMGKVIDVGLFATEIKSFDGLFQFVPNNELWNTKIINYTRNPQRLMRITIGIGYGDDPSKARDVLEALARNDPRVLSDPAPSTFVAQLGDSAVNVELRAWAGIDDYWNALRELTQKAKSEIEAAGIDIPFPQRVVHMIPDDQGKT